jgi:hypothetical protein
MKDKKAARDAKQAAMFAKLAVADTENWRRRISKADPHHASVAEQKMFYALLLQIVWLSDDIRKVVMKRLGVNKTDWKRASARWLQYKIAEYKAREGCDYRTAVDKVADELSIARSTVKQRITRSRK